jgi:hypothetical protein
MMGCKKQFPWDEDCIEVLMLLLAAGDAKRMELDEWYQIHVDEDEPLQAGRLGYLYALSKIIGMCLRKLQGIPDNAVVRALPDPRRIGGADPISLKMTQCVSFAFNQDFAGLSGVGYGAIETGEIDEMFAGLADYAGKVLRETHRMVHAAPHPRGQQARWN